MMNLKNKCLPRDLLKHKIYEGNYYLGTYGQRVESMFSVFLRDINFYFVTENYEWK